MAGIGTEHGAIEPEDSSRRIFGLETEFGLTYSGGELNADEAARELFADVVAWGRSTNVFIRNASRLYLDVGSHPEYATAECDSLDQLIAYDRAGLSIVDDMVRATQHRLDEAGHTGTLHVFKNNVDSAGNSCGCHENYLVRRRADFTALGRSIVPFLIARQILVGAGHVLETPTGHIYCFSQRADHMWEAVSSATTRARPLINTRDEPHADSTLYRRLHVIVGDSSMAQPTCLLKVGTMDLILRCLEAGVEFKNLSLAKPMKAIRDISHDISGQALVDLENGQRFTAADIAESYLDQVTRALDGPVPSREDDARVLGLWRRVIDAVRSQDYSGIDRDIDWAIKKKLIDQYCESHGLELGDPRVARLELAYHDISPAAGLLVRMEESELVSTLVSKQALSQAAEHPPQSTRAALRGRFIAAALAAGCDSYAVDWVHVKITGDEAAELALTDPFASQDSRVDDLIATLSPILE